MNIKYSSCNGLPLGWVKGVERFLLSVGLNMKLLCGIEATSILPAEGVNKPAAFAKYEKRTHITYQQETPYTT